MADIRLPPRHRPNARIYLDSGDITMLMIQDDLLASLKLEQLQMIYTAIDKHLVMRREVPNDDE